ncbi:MAG: hypothetical protein ACFFDT_12090 [Candidatus Hodarchaeota archaeon]
MDFNQLATDVTLFLAPLLPYLILSGEATAKKIGEEFGEVTLAKAKTLWDKIKKSAQDDTKLQGVATALAEYPDDEDFQVTLAKLLAKQFATSSELAEELMKILKEDKAIQTVLIEQESKAKNISQRLSKSGTQQVKVRDKSEVGDVNQEM